MLSVRELNSRTAATLASLRSSWGLHLQVRDIESQRMLVHIHRGKGAKDRLVPLPQSTLIELRKYYASHRNPRWIFPCEGRNHKLAPTADRPMSDSSVQGVIKAVLEQLNWGNRGISTHTLRHCYATHLLEAGVNLRLIQKYLGHKHLTSTMVYFKRFVTLGSCTSGPRFRESG